MAEQNISAEEADRLREMLLKYDRDRPPNVFDLSKPPVKSYTHQAFPKVVYNHEASVPEHVIKKKDLLNNAYQQLEPAKLVTKNVNSSEELADELEQGWSTKPPVFDQGEADWYTQPTNVLPVLASEPAQHVAPRGPGRPRKVAEV